MSLRNIPVAEEWQVNMKITLIAEPLDVVSVLIQIFFGRKLLIPYHFQLIGFLPVFERKQQHNKNEVERQRIQRQLQVTEYVSKRSMHHGNQRTDQYCQQIRFSRRNKKKSPDTNGSENVVEAYKVVIEWLGAAVHILKEKITGCKTDDRKRESNARINKQANGDDQTRYNVVLKINSTQRFKVGIHHTRKLQ